MKKTLVVYHSRTGHTRRVAEALAELLDAELDEIVTETPRRGLLGYVVCALEALTGATPGLKRMRHDPSHYERVVIGTPVWFWSASSPVHAWALRHAMGSAQLGFFCTMGGSGADSAFAQLASLCGRTPVATLALTARGLDGDIRPELDRFVAALARRPAARPAASRCGEEADAHPPRHGMRAAR